VGVVEDTTLIAQRAVDLLGVVEYFLQDLAIWLTVGS
jgi:hypothetical protein